VGNLSRSKIATWQNVNFFVVMKWNNPPQGIYEMNWDVAIDSANMHLGVNANGGA
jgi:hypothetical protein